MRHRKATKAAKPDAKYGSMKVDPDIRDRINAAVKKQGMTTAGAFRRFESQIISVIKQEQPAVDSPAA
jgi:hypothetical protein